MTEAVSSQLSALPPSSVLVYRVLQAEGPAIATELSEITYMPDSTVRLAINRLEDHDLIKSRPGVDARTTVYSVRE